MQYATSRHAEWEKWLEKKSEFNQYCILFEELTIKQQNAIVLDHSKESVLQKIDRMKTIIGNDLERNMFATTATPDQKERRGVLLAFLSTQYFLQQLLLRRL